MSTDKPKDDPSNGVTEEERLATCKEEQPQPQGEDFTIVREKAQSTKGKAPLSESGMPSPSSGPEKFKEQREEENRQPTRAYFE
jgi:hypothetical protein